MTPEQFRVIQTRRRFFEQGAYGLGTIALAHLMGVDGRAGGAPASQDPLAAKPPQFPAKAKNVIFLFMGGGPSQMVFLTPRQKLNESHAKPLPDSLQKDLAAALAQRPNTSSDS